MSLTMERSSRRGLLVIIAMITLGIFIISLSLGSERLSLTEIMRGLLVNDGSPLRRIVWITRVPRVFISALVGVALALSGAALQGVMRNPLASPNIIGVSSGGGLAAVIILILYPENEYLVTPVAFLGALGATLLIYRIAWKRGAEPLRLVMTGVAVSAMLGAGINTLMILYPDRVQNVILFFVGGLSTLTWEHFYGLLPYTAAGLLLCGLGANRLNILTLGDETASSLGINVERTRFFFIITASLLAASAVSVVGLLGFVGLIAPHIARLICGSNYRYLFPASALLGAALVMGGDTIGRLIISPAELPVGIVMAALGAPFFLYLLKKGGRK